MKKYTVSMAIDGRIDVDVEAESVAEAFERAYGAIGDADFNKMECCDIKPVTCYDADGNIMEDYNG